MSKLNKGAKDERFEIRCYGKEKRRWKKLAGKGGLSALISRLLNDECDKKGVK